ncbi:TetR/AcrR family transcriptional regulator [Pseudonocardia sp. CA-107938]|uniref:TetR/AcrR family transcriptional regulator n=1 Tax=Pseudonocardia sp. CA-107938 TaxID=3240021 RepID=UPI003D8DEFA0
MSAADTRRKLLDGAIDTVRAEGLGGTSARSIARTAGVNQALIFYHFDTVDALLAEAARRTTEQRVGRYRARFAAVTTLGELLAAGRALWAEEEAHGAAMVLAQLLAGAQTSPALAEGTAAALGLWATEVETALRRVLPQSPLAGLLDPVATAQTVTAAFAGLSLFGAIGATPDALGQLEALVALVDDLGPVERRLVARRLARRAERP